MKTYTFLFLLVSSLLFLSACAKNNNELPNPASVYCENHTGKLEIKTDANGGQYGLCIFPDGSVCDEWAYYRGECQIGDSLKENKTAQ